MMLSPISWLIKGRTLEDRYGIQPKTNHVYRVIPQYEKVSIIPITIMQENSLEMWSELKTVTRANRKFYYREMPEYAILQRGTVWKVVHFGNDLEELRSKIAEAKRRPPYFKVFIVAATYAMTMHGEDIALDPKEICR